MALCDDPDSGHNAELSRRLSISTAYSPRHFGIVAYGLAEQS